jgi:uroporphyrinogen-III decarboxylase
MVDMAETYKIMGEDVMLCGNLDPVSVIMSGTKELIKKKYEEVKISIPQANWIMMGGCEIPRDTPIMNMQYLREISMKY